MGSPCRWRGVERRKRVSLRGSLFSFFLSHLPLFISAPFGHWVDACAARFVWIALQRRCVASALRLRRESNEADAEPPCRRLFQRRPHCSTARQPPRSLACIQRRRLPITVNVQRKGRDGAKKERKKGRKRKPGSHLDLGLRQCDAHSARRSPAVFLSHDHPRRPCRRSARRRTRAGRPRGAGLASGRAAPRAPWPAFARALASARRSVGLVPRSARSLLCAMSWPRAQTQQEPHDGRSTLPPSATLAFPCEDGLLSRRGADLGAAPARRAHNRVRRVPGACRHTAWCMPGALHRAE